jgi:hypothetical protein
MDATQTERIALALFVASELIGMSRLRSNSLLQLLLAAALRAFPYAPRPRPPQGPLGGLFDRKDRR